MSVTLGGIGCLEPRTLLRDIADRGLSAPWAALPNSYTCPIGTGWGEGHVLMSASSLEELSPDGTFPDLYDLTFTSTPVGPGKGTVTIRNLLVQGGECVTPGVRGGESAFLVRLVDRRWFLARYIADRAYNLRHVLTGAWIPQTTFDGAGTPCTWGTVVHDLWAFAPMLGPFPGLPFSPDGIPEDVECYQAPVADALDMVLTRLGCALILDPVADTFGIVLRGAPDQALDAALAAWDGYRHWDGYRLDPRRASTPGAVRVTFRKIPHYRGHSSPFVAIGIPDLAGDATSLASVESGTVALAPDDLEALYDPYGQLINLPALQARAVERAADYYRRLKGATGGLRLVYPLAMDEPGLRPGSQVDAVRWHETAASRAPEAGCVTEVTRARLAPPPNWPVVGIDPLTEIVKLNGPVIQGGLTDGVVLAWDPLTFGWVEQRVCWLVDVNDSPAGEFVLATNPDTGGDYSLTTGGGDGYVLVPDPTVPFPLPEGG